MRLRVFLSLLVVVMASLASAARADVEYTFSGINTTVSSLDGLSVGFTYISPDFIVATSTVPGGTVDPVYPSQLGSCLNCTTTPNFPAVFFEPGETGPNGLADVLQFDDSTNNGGGYVYYFNLGDFNTPGTYSTIVQPVAYNVGTLTVSVVNVPEPASIGLMLIGGLLLAGMILKNHKSLSAMQLG
jgi:hypothetical protein